MGATYNPGFTFIRGRGFGNGHYGIDYSAPGGTNIPAAADGGVVYSGFNGSGSGPTGTGYGYTVIIEHSSSNGDVYYTLYGHMNGNDMPPVGTSVSKGETIGEVGNTGHSYGNNGGNHEHFEVIDSSELPSGFHFPNAGPLGISGDRGRINPDDFHDWPDTGGYGGGTPDGGGTNGFPYIPGLGIVPPLINDLFTKARGIAAPRRDPLILDLDGDGIETIASTDGAYFDHDGNGFAERTGWVSPDDGLLVMDRNNDGIINNGGELFGDQTILQNGLMATDSFQALADLDNNADGKIDTNDTAFSQLRIWQDADGDGYSSTDELKSLAELEISTLNIAHTDTNTPDGHGNTQIQAGTFSKIANTTGQMAAFLLQRDTAYTVPEEWSDAPVIIDLDGDGIETVASTDGAFFDHDGNGFVERNGWVSAHDGLLVMDRNNDGIINNGGEFFGNQTILRNGQRATNGFQALADLDGDADGKVDVNDAAFSQIKIWQDIDGDGYSTVDELKSLSQMGISAINTVHTVTNTPDGHGNTQIQAGTFEKTDGTTGQTAGVLLQRDTTYTMAEGWLDVPPEIAILPDLQGYGNVYDLQPAMVRDESGQLKGLVESFVATTDASMRSSLMQQILLKWTGTENVDPTSRGLDIDARKLAVLEKLLGQAFVGADGTSNPNINAIAPLNHSYQCMFEMYYARLMSQTHLRDLYEKITYTWDETAKSIRGDLSTVIEELQNRLAADSVTGKQWFTEFTRTLGGFQALEMMNFDDYKAVFAPMGEDFAWSVHSTGKYIITGTARNDAINGYNGNVAITGLKGDDYLNGNAGNDVLFGGEGNDQLSAGGGNDILSGGEGSDTLVSGTGDDSLSGGADDDMLFGNDGNDVLTGGTGKDTLYGEGGNDILEGGAGDDYLHGGGGDDTFIFRKGSGNDTISRDLGYGSNYNPNGTDTVNLGEGLTADSFDYLGKGLNEGGDLILLIKGTGETLTIKSWFADARYQVDKLHFADGSELSAADVGARAVILPIMGTEGDDNLFTAAVADHSNTVYGLGGNDILASGTGNDTLVGGEGNDQMVGAGGNDILSGDEGNDTLYGGLGDDSLAAGEGQDMLSGDEGDDVLTGGAGDDTLYGGDGNDVLDGGSGDDYLDGHLGDDTFVYGKGSGNDVIQRGFNWSGYPNGIDTVQFGEDLTADSFDYVGKGLNEGGDLMLRINDTGETLTIKNWFIAAQYQVDKFHFADGTELTAAEVGARTEILPIIGTEGDDNLFTATVSDHNNRVYGLGGDDILAGGAGNDTLVGGAGNDQIAGGGGNDTLSGDGGNDTIYGGLGDDNASGGTGDDLIFCNNGDDSLAGGAGNDILDGEEGNDFLEGGGGDDYLHGGGGDDTFVFGRGSGDDTIQREVSYYWLNWNPSGTDTVQFGEGLTADSFDYIGKSLNEGGDLILRIKDTGETLTIKNWFVDAQYRVDKFHFADGGQLAATDVESRSANHAPTILHPIQDQSAAEEAVFTYTIPADTFADIDMGDGLIYSATLGDGTALPSWLTFNAATKTFNGAPTNSDVGILPLKVTATDNAGASVSCSFQVTVANVNDTPVIATPLVNQSAMEDATFSFTIPANTFADVDVGDGLIYSATLGDGKALPSWLTFNAATKTFNGAPTNSDVGILSLKVTATDNAGASVSGSFQVTVANVNDTPVIAIPLVNQSAMEDATFSFTIPANTFTDVDVGDSLTYSATLGNGMALPSWLTFNAAMKTFSGTPANGDVGILPLKVTAADAAGASVSGSFQVTVANVNDAPAVATPLADQSAVKGEVFTFTIPANTFADVDMGDSLTYRATLSNGKALPSWLVFNPATKTFNGTPGGDDVGALSLKLTVTDASGASVSDDFDLTVKKKKDNIITGTDIGETLMGTDYADIMDALGGNDTLYGYNGDDTLFGGAGNDILAGGAGADTMSGGPGDDTYYVDDPGDVVTESPKEGTDSVQSSVTCTLGKNIENLTLTGTAAINGTGNNLDNRLYGNSAANVISGDAGDDYIAAEDGNDTLSGEAGDDILDGGKGSDTYLFHKNDGKDRISDYSTQGTDIDTVKMEKGIQNAKCVILKEDNDLYFVVDLNNYLKVDSQFKSSSYGIERLEMADGYYVTRQDIENIVNTMSSINNDPGMDIIQKFHMLQHDQTYINILAQSWRQA